MSDCYSVVSIPEMYLQLSYHFSVSNRILYNYRLLMRSTRYHVDRVWYWLTDAVGGGLPIHDKVYMVPSRPKSKVYNCFIKLSGILHKIYFNHKETSMALSAASKNRRETRCVYCDVIRKCTPNSPVWAKNWRVNLRFRCDITENPNRPSLSICGQFTLRYTRVNAVSANQRRAKEGEFPDHLINVFVDFFKKYCWSNMFRPLMSV